MRLTSPMQRRLVLCASLLGSAAIPAIVPAGEPAGDGALSWQFKPGQTLHWTLDQTVQMRAPQGDKIAEANFKQIIDFDVNVASVEQEVATLAISTSRVRAEIDLPDGKVSYDSDAAKAPAEKKAEKKKGTPRDDADEPAEDAEADPADAGQELIAGMLAPVRELKFSVAVDKQCAVQSVTIDKDRLQAFRSFRPLQSFMILFEKAGFSSAYLGGFVKLPAGGLPAGQTWNSKVVSFASGPLGRASFEHAFRGEGTVMIDGRELQKFAATVQMAFDGPENELFKLGKQTGTGVLYFDAQQGRVRSSQWSLTAQLLFDDGKVEGQLKLETKSEIRE